MSQRGTFKRKGKRSHWLFRGWGLLVLFGLLLVFLYLLFAYCFRNHLSLKTEESSSIASSLVMMENGSGGVGDGGGGVGNNALRVATTKAKTTPPTVQEKIAKMLFTLQMQEQQHEAQVAAQVHEEHVHHNTIVAKHTPLLPHLAAKKAERLKIKAGYLTKLFAAQAEYDEAKAGTTSMSIPVEPPPISPMTVAAPAAAPPTTMTTTTTTPGNEQGQGDVRTTQRGRRRSRGGGDTSKVFTHQEPFLHYVRANKSRDTLLDADFYVNETGLPLSTLALGIPVMRRNRTNGEGMSWQQFMQKPIFEQEIERLEEQDAFAPDGAGSSSNVTSRRKKRMLLVKDANEQLQSNIIRVTKGHICKPEVAKRLVEPSLTKENITFCKWALTEGKVIVGKSWGKLEKDKEGREKFDALNCNIVQENMNPSCDDAWGEGLVKKWRENKSICFGCDDSSNSNHSYSKIECFENANLDKSCVLTKAQLNFDMVRTVIRAKDYDTNTREFDKGFLSVDLSAAARKFASSAPPFFPFEHLFSLSPPKHKDHCDVVINGTMLLFSHDLILNLGHTLQDEFNVFMMLWLDKGRAKNTHLTPFLNMDALKLGHNFNDEPNSFFETYLRTFPLFYKASSFIKETATVCVDRLLIQPVKPMFFVWESWWKDLPCSFVGPSSLYQRWNLHTRNNYNFFDEPLDDLRLQTQLQVLLVVRREYKNLWANQRSSRNFLNYDEIYENLEDSMHKMDLQEMVSLASQSAQGVVPNITFVAVDFKDLPFPQQLRLIARSSIIVGMHGAGIASMMHMSIGSRFCCGAIEIYPAGEFTPIRGHGNMARKMGLHWDRLDLSKKDSRDNGAMVPVDKLADIITKMIRQIIVQPTCVLPAVVQDPFLANT